MYVPRCFSKPHYQVRLGCVKTIFWGFLTKPNEGNWNFIHLKWAPGAVTVFKRQLGKMFSRSKASRQAFSNFIVGSEVHYCINEGSLFVVVVVVFRQMTTAAKSTSTHKRNVEMVDTTNNWPKCKFTTSANQRKRFFLSDLNVSFDSKPVDGFTSAVDNDVFKLDNIR